jgi:hypothetical protein
MLNKTLAPILFTNLWVAVCFAGMVYGINRHFKVEGNHWYALFAFSGTLTAYQFHRLIRLRQFREHISTSERLVWMLRHHMLLQVLFVLSGLISAICIWIIQPNTQQVLFLGITGSIILLYPLRLPFIRLSIRSLPFLKILLISGIWTISALFAVAEQRNGELVLPALLVFFATAAQVIPFDIRDISYDTKSMRTVPQLFGVTGARIVATALIIGASGLLIVITHEACDLFLYTIPALISCWLPIRPKDIMWLEFLWELPMLMLGLVFLC